MAISEAQRRAVAKYIAKSYDRTLVRLPKGKLDLVKKCATMCGQSVNGFINAAIEEKMEKQSP